MEKCNHFNAMVRAEDTFGYMYCYGCNELVQFPAVLNAWGREIRRLQKEANELIATLTASIVEAHEHHKKH